MSFNRHSVKTIISQRRKNHIINNRSLDDVTHQQQIHGNNSINGHLVPAALSHNLKKHLFNTLISRYLNLYQTLQGNSVKGYPVLISDAQV